MPASLSYPSKAFGVLGTRLPTGVESGQARSLVTCTGVTSHGRHSRMPGVLYQPTQHGTRRLAD